MPISPPRTKKQKRGFLHPVKAIPHSQEGGEFEEQEKVKGRPVVKSELKKLYNWPVARATYQKK